MLGRQRDLRRAQRKPKRQAAWISCGGTRMPIPCDLGPVRRRRTPGAGAFERVARPLQLELDPGRQVAPCVPSCLAQEAVCGSALRRAVERRRGSTGSPSSERQCRRKSQLALEATACVRRRNPVTRAASPLRGCRSGRLSLAHEAFVLCARLPAPARCGERHILRRRLGACRRNPLGRRSLRPCKEFLRAPGMERDTRRTDGCGFSRREGNGALRQLSESLGSFSLHARQ
jgi:hypothetical protein